MIEVQKQTLLGLIQTYHREANRDLTRASKFIEEIGIGCGQILAEDGFSPLSQIVRSALARNYIVANVLQNNSPEQCRAYDLLTGTEWSLHGPPAVMQVLLTYQNVFFERNQKESEETIVIAGRKLRQETFKLFHIPTYEPVTGVSLSEIAQ